MFDVITIGDSVVDTYAMIDENCPQSHLSPNKKLLCLNYGDKIDIFEAGMAVGGNAANVAVGMRRLGAKVAIVTSLGKDLNAEFILKTLKKEKIDTSLIEQSRRNKTRYSLVLNYRGERTILAYHSKTHYSLPSMPSTQWVYYSSLGKDFEKIQSKLLQYLKKHPKTGLAVNPGSYQIKHSLEHFKQILPYTSVLFVNKEEAELITGKKTTPKKLLFELQKLGPKTIVITDGKQGSYASDGTKAFFSPIYNTKNISKTGAGDAYASGFLSALLQGKDLFEAMQWGSANAASVIGHIGAQVGLLKKTKISSYLKKFSSLGQKKLI